MFTFMFYLLINTLQQVRKSIIFNLRHITKVNNIMFNDNFSKFTIILLFLTGICVYLSKKYTLLENKNLIDSYNKKKEQIMPSFNDKYILHLYDPYYAHMDEEQSTRYHNTFLTKRFMESDSPYRIKQILNSNNNDVRNHDKRLKYDNYDINVLNKDLQIRSFRNTDPWLDREHLYAVPQVISSMDATRLKNLQSDKSSQKNYNCKSGKKERPASGSCILNTPMFLSTLNRKILPGW